MSIGICACLYAYGHAHACMPMSSPHMCMPLCLYVSMPMSSPHIYLLIIRSM